MAIANRSISQFKSALKGGGQRPNLFEVELSKPSGVTFGVQPGTTSTNELESNISIDHTTTQYMNVFERFLP